MTKPILIAATSLDEHAFGPVRSELESQGYPVAVYQTDKVLEGNEQLYIKVSGDGELIMRYDDTPIAPDQIGAVWYRKVAAFRPSDNIDDKAKQLHINSEIQALHDTLWAVYPDELWLNSPQRMRNADRKLGQLLLAHELGFSIPHTIIGNSWDDIDAELLAGNKQLVVKTIRGIISDRDIMKAMYTTVLDAERLQSLKDWTTPFPGIYQPFIGKLREWRVTAVGDTLFPAAIYTEEEARDDWRKHQLSSSVHFKNEDLPADIAERCFRFLGRLGLKFGAFDFIETPEGEMIFLECNPNGQYGWLEDELGLPISSAIAAELIKIANTRG